MELTLVEWVATLPKGHRARLEFLQLNVDLTTAEKELEELREESRIWEKHSLVAVVARAEKAESDLFELRFPKANPEGYACPACGATYKETK